MLNEFGVNGFFALVKGELDELCHFGLLPKTFGKDYGNILFEQIILECALLKTELYITSYPDAEEFYLKKRAFNAGEVCSEAKKNLSS